MNDRVRRWTVGWASLWIGLSALAYGEGTHRSVCLSPEGLRGLVSATRPWLPDGWPEWSAETWGVHIWGWSAQGDWESLQAAAYVLDVCGADSFARRAWSTGLRAYLQKGGIPVYAQAPEAFPWWRLWEAEYAWQGVTPALAARFLRASVWTPNLWDRGVRSGVLAETFRQQGAIDWDLRIRETERVLARDLAAYRVAPLEWRARAMLLESALDVWGWAVAAGLAFGMTLGASPRLSRPIRIWPWLLLGSGAWAAGLAILQAWYASAFSTWQVLRDSLLRDGFIRRPPPPWDVLFEPVTEPRDLPRALRDLPTRWRAYLFRSPELWSQVDGDSPVLDYNRALLARDTDRIDDARQAAPYLIGPWRDLVPDRLIPPVPTWPELHTLSASARWTVVLKNAAYSMGMKAIHGIPHWGLGFGVLLLVGSGVRYLHERLGRIGRWAARGLSFLIPGSSRFWRGHP
ncbi:MAG: hypothetical protein RMK16_05830, partial [Acidobacteriota bacterium]|nr:hypothetical protein [Acidobacteriota bacterium]